MLLRRVLLLLSLLSTPFAGAEDTTEYWESLPLTCDMQDDTGCRIRALITWKGIGLKQMYEDGRYERLEEKLRAQCAGGRLPDGQPQLLIFHQAFANMFTFTRDRRAEIARLAAWRKAAPNSMARPLAEAIFWDQYAWAARGGGYARSVPKEAWELFHERGAKALRVLEESRAVASNCPLWHSLRISTLIEQSRDRREVAAAYAEAVAKFPDAQMIHFAMAEALLPKWGGSAKAFDQFARDVARRTAATEGNGMYARLYWAQDCQCDEALRFDDPDSLVSWPLMKQGFEDLLRRYPMDLYNRNKFAALACRAGDKATYAKRRREIGTHVYDELWHPSWMPEVCDKRLLDPA